MEPACDEKALVLEDYLVIADLHIGLEREFSEKGIHVPSQLGRMEDRILELLRTTGKEKLVLLGDLKHNIPAISWQEHNEIPGLIDRLSSHAEVTLVKGNHDGGIERVIPGLEVRKELAVNNEALLLHGHTMPDEQDYDYIIMAHNHPCIEFRGEFGRSISESAWIRTSFKREHLARANLRKNPEIIVMPAFNDLIYGMPFNAARTRLLGPFFRRGLVEVDNARVFLLDSTYLGRLKDLRQDIPGQKGSQPEGHADLE